MRYRNIDFTQIEVNTGKSLETLSNEKPVMLIFLRHFGCVFCVESLRIVERNLENWEKSVHVVLVHMGSSKQAQNYLSKFNLQGILNISNPSTSLYSKFGLKKGRMGQLLGLKVWSRMAELAAKDKIVPMAVGIGDEKQMPGIFVIHENKIIDEFIHSSVADIPNYDKMINCCKA